VRLGGGGNEDQVWRSAPVIAFLGIDGQCKSAIRKKPRSMMPPADRLRAAHVRGTNRALNIRRAVARCRQHGDEKR
jgi:hypothetical protein